MNKKKITISLSEKSLHIMEELRTRTDADTDSEIFRNALRLHLALIRAEAAGIGFFMKQDGKEVALSASMFVEAYGESNGQ